MKTEKILKTIMAEIQGEVTNFLTKVAEERPELVELEMGAREIGLRCGSKVLEGAIQLYGKGYQGQKIECKCGKGKMEFIRYDRSAFTSATGQIQAISAYYHCNRCKRSRWPAFESLGLGPGSLSEGAGRIAAWAGAIAGGFKRSGEIVKKLSGQVSKHSGKGDRANWSKEGAKGRGGKCVKPGG